MIEFDEEKHEYKVDGKVKPSVTTILKETGVWPDFWGNDEDREFYMQRGRMVHLAIHHIMTMKPFHEHYAYTYVHKQDKRIQGYLESFMDWAMSDQWNVKPIDSEKKVYNKPNDYCGTIDMIADVNFREERQEKAIIDFKCGDPACEYAYQLAGYEMCVEPVAFGKRLRLGVYLNKEGKHPRVCPYLDETDFQVFRACRYVYSKQSVRR